MNINNSEILKEVYSGLLEERDSVQSLLDKNLSCIMEIEKFLKSMDDEENPEFKVFSPRKPEDLYRENIDNSKMEKRVLELDNQAYYKRINRLNKYIDGIKEVLQDGMEDQAMTLDYSACFENKLQQQNMFKNLQVLDIQEKERQRIARDLHDTSLQNLAHLVHKIELSSMFIDQDPIRAKLELAAINKNLKSVMDEMRNTIFDLRPMSFDDLGLKECFERLFIKLKETNKKIDFISDIKDSISGNDLVLMTIFRLVQECCSNAIKHSGCDKIYISVREKENCYYICVKDKGQGFSMKEMEGKKDRHFGLEVMKERVELLGGNLMVHSDKMQGTKVEIEIPKESIRGN